MDKNNRPVADLKQDDFLIFEDGKPQQVSFFSLIRPAMAVSPQPSAGASKSSPVAAPEPGRFIFLILDQHHISRDSYPRLRDSILRFINEDLCPQDQLAVIGTRACYKLCHRVSYMHAT